MDKEILEMGSKKKDYSKFSFLFALNWKDVNLSWLVKYGSIHVCTIRFVSKNLYMHNWLLWTYTDKCLFETCKIINNKTNLHKYHKCICKYLDKSLNVYIDINGKKTQTKTSTIWVFVDQHCKNVKLLQIKVLYAEFHFSKKSLSLIRIESVPIMQ